MKKTVLGQAIQRVLYAGLLPMAASPAAFAADQAAATTTANDTSTDRKSTRLNSSHH